MEAHLDGELVRAHLRVCSALNYIGRSHCTAETATLGSLGPRIARQTLHNLKTHQRRRKRLLENGRRKSREYEEGGKMTEAIQAYTISNKEHAWLCKRYNTRPDWQMEKDLRINLQR